MCVWYNFPEKSYNVQEKLHLLKPEKACNPSNTSDETIKYPEISFMPRFLYGTALIGDVLNLCFALPGEGGNSNQILSAIVSREATLAEFFINKSQSLISHITS